MKKTIINTLIFTAMLGFALTQTACKKDVVENIVEGFSPKLIVPHWGNNTVTAHVIGQSARKQDTMSFTANGASVNAANNGANAIAVDTTHRFAFISFDNGNGGVVKYNFTGRKTDKPTSANQFASIGSSLGLALNSANTSLYVAQPNRLTIFTNPHINLDQYQSCPTVPNGFLAGVAVAPNGDVWVSDYNNNCLWYYSKASLNTPGQAVNRRIDPRIVTSSSGFNPLVSPEGLAFDNLGNLYIGNNNDGSNQTKKPITTLVKIDATQIAGVVASSTYNTPSFTTINIPNKVGNNPTGYAGQIGGLLFYNQKLYVHDQEHSCIWVYDTTDMTKAPTYILSGDIASPGFGGMAMAWRL